MSQSRNTHARLNDRGKPTETDTEPCAYLHCSTPADGVEHMGESFCSRVCALHYQMDYSEVDDE